MSMNQDLLSAIWERLNEPEPWRRNVEGGNRIASEISKSGRCTRPDLEDMLEAFDSRLYGIDVWALADYIDAPRRSVYSKPRFLNAMNIGFEAIASSDAAGLVIFLEQLGFLVESNIRKHPANSP